jgi:hypothetical protein
MITRQEVCSISPFEITGKFFTLLFIKGFIKGTLSQDFNLLIFSKDPTWALE